MTFVSYENMPKMKNSSHLLSLEKMKKEISSYVSSVRKIEYINYVKKTLQTLILQYVDIEIRYVSFLFKEEIQYDEKFFCIDKVNLHDKNNQAITKYEIEKNIKKRSLKYKEKILNNFENLYFVLFSYHPVIDDNQDGCFYIDLDSDIIEYFTK